MHAPDRRRGKHMWQSQNNSRPSCHHSVHDICSLDSPDRLAPRFARAKRKSKSVLCYHQRGQSSNKWAASRASANTAPAPTLSGRLAGELGPDVITPRTEVGGRGRDTRGNVQKERCYASLQAAHSRKTHPVSHTWHSNGLEACVCMCLWIQKRHKAREEVNLQMHHLRASRSLRLLSLQTHSYVLSPHLIQSQRQTPHSITKLQEDWTSTSTRTVLLKLSCSQILHTMPQLLESSKIPLYLSKLFSDPLWRWFDSWNK